MAVRLAMAAGPDQVGRPVLCSHSQPIRTLPCLSGVIKVLASSWSFGLVLSAWCPFPPPWEASQSWFPWDPDPDL